ncbi:hypothetical protein ES703_13456 [subsurface metagenome]
MNSEKSKKELAAILTLLQVRGFGPVKFKQIYESFKSFEKIFHLSKQELINFNFENRYLFSIELGFDKELRRKTISDELRESFRGKKFGLSDKATVSIYNHKSYKIKDRDREFYIKLSNGKFSVMINVACEILFQKSKFSDNLNEADRQLQKAKNHNAYLITYFNDYYPPNLYLSNHCVPLLYAIGEKSILKETKCCSVVGTRKPTAWTVKNTKIAVRKLVKNGYTIVSGLALGTDAIAHETAIVNNGKTISVLGCGIDIVYPFQNEILRKKIINNGVIISEYTFGTRVQEFMLKKRNKITVGLSKYILISQTSKKGGTMNAYKAAIEQKKPVGVFLPPRKLHKEFSGNFQIINETKIPVQKFSGGDKIDIEW